MIQAEILPDFLGGQCDCHEVGGNCMLSNIGPWQDYELVMPKGIKAKNLRY